MNPFDSKDSLTGPTICDSNRSEVLGLEYILANTHSDPGANVR